MKDERFYTVDNNRQEVTIHDAPTLGQSLFCSIIPMDSKGRYTEALRYYRNSFYLRRAWNDIGNLKGLN